MTLVCGEEVTLPNIKDPLAVIDYVTERLLKQNRKAVQVFGDYGSTCVFRVKDEIGLCGCAIGVLLPDDLVQLDKTGSVINNNRLWRYLREEYHTDTTEDDMPLDELRDIHNHHDPEEWPELLKELRLKWEKKVKA